MRRLMPAAALLSVLLGGAARSADVTPGELLIVPAPRPGETARLCREMLEGNAESARRWRELSAPARTAALAALAVRPVQDDPDNLTRARAILGLGLQPGTDDPECTGLKALMLLAVAESSRELRTLAREGLAARADPRALNWLADKLDSKDNRIRENAEDALMLWNGPHVFEVVIEHWRDSTGSGPRAHAFFGTQRSYISDYNISGSTYDPVVSTVLSGIVLEAAAPRMENGTHIVFIRELAGDMPKPADNPGAWRQWLLLHGSELAKKAERNRTNAIAALKQRFEAIVSSDAELRIVSTAHPDAK